MTEASGSIALCRFDDACALIDETLITEEADAPSSPRLAAGGSFVAMAWTDTAEVGATVSVQARPRLVTELLCE